ncbi:pseudoazurin (plasmid) [Nitratireductor sp. L1-7-SE]|uniref:Pseudoazurin n=1 Tax=Nitratireductor rhodophyticola TaxID=2854036 RepID=A0ABS7RC13_9HYPH|nr:pseudoazurin [Nitratireductor rhodophyticola]MBY8918469.1 pseudoazurin [Nitratireductor rhodophyticola]MBY8922812.1 pseudoazurin [Nitratireductor rhodophyticola]
MTAIKTAAFLAAGLALGITVAPGLAAEFEIRMLNKGEKGVMVFEPDFVRAQPGDTIKFVSVDPGHNAETIKGMLPEGAAAFRSKVSKDFSVTLTEEGVYGVKCTPHYGMGMIALIAVGEPVNGEAAARVKHPGKAKKHFATLFEALPEKLAAK